MNFEKLTISEWKQFENLDIDFHSRLTILTGANGSGKTTILNLLAQHFNWNFQELSTPAKDKQSGVFKFFTRFFKNPFSQDDSKIGELIYDDGSKSNINVPKVDSPQYLLQIEKKQAVVGLYIPSNRQVFIYHPVSNLSIKKRKKTRGF